MQEALIRKVANEKLFSEKAYLKAVTKKGKSFE